MVKFTLQKWVDKVYEQQNELPKYKIKIIIRKTVLLLQSIILNGDMLVIPNVGRFVVVVKKPKFGVRNLSDLSQAPFTLPERKKLCFFAQRHYKALQLNTIMKPDFKKVSIKDCLSKIKIITNNSDLAKIILLTLTSTMERLLDVNSPFNKIEIEGLLVLTAAIAKERKGRNPNTGNPIIIKEKLKYSFNEPLAFKKLLSNKNTLK